MSEAEALAELEKARNEISRLKQVVCELRGQAGYLTRDQFENLMSWLAAKFPAFDPGQKAMARGFEELSQCTFAELLDVIARICEMKHYGAASVPQAVWGDLSNQVRLNRNRNVLAKEMDRIKGLSEEKKIGLEVEALFGK